MQGIRWLTDTSEGFGYGEGVVTRRPKDQAQLDADLVVFE